MHKILDEAMDHTRQILSAHRDQLDILTNELVEKETLDDAEIRVLLGFAPLEAADADTQQTEAPAREETPTAESTTENETTTQG